MILRYGATKWRHNNLYPTTFKGWVYCGSATTLPTVPQLPRLPMIPDASMERTWLQYFREMHRIIEEHMEDYQLHKVK
jgi:hypothetical protein